MRERERETETERLIHFELKKCEQKHRTDHFDYSNSICARNLTKIRIRFKLEREKERKSERARDLQILS
jgi:hypothetical protein